MACASPLILISSSFMSSSKILPEWITGIFVPSSVVVSDFDIGISFRFPLGADSSLVINSDAVRMLLVRVVAEHAPPFDVKVPNGTTVEALRERPTRVKENV